MKNNIIPIFTLQEIVQSSAEALFEENVIVFETNECDLEEFEFNYPHKVDFMGLMLVIAGEVRIRVDFEETTLKEMDIVTLLPNSIIEFISVSKDCRMRGALGSLDYMSILQFNVDSSEAIQLFSNTYSNFVSLDETVYRAVSYHMARIEALNRQSETPFLSELIKSHITLMLYELVSFKQRYERKHVFTSVRKEEIAVRFIGLVAAHFKKYRDVNFYAEKMHISRKHLTKSIKEVYAATPKQIIDQKIVGEAKVLLQKIDLSIGQVMVELGFDDQAAFSKFFKHNSGMSPLAYRKQQLKSS